ncbi:MAG TPA: pitrilysin family protein [Gemmatimonadales bacterium]|nr:pitrilysin family protein [Gemmatimonadales bacterium]
MRTLMLLGSLAVLAAPLAAQKEAPPQPGTPRDFRVPPRRTITLANGMKVTLVHYGVVPKVAVNLMLATGGIDEAPNEVELAGLTAGMLTEGTTTRTAAEISRVAAEMGGSLTAGAGDDQTNVGGEVLSEFADRYVALLADVVLHPRFADEDVARLRANRIRDNAIALSTPAQMTRQKFRQMMFGDHPYARIFAPESLLASYTAATVRGFHAKNYGARRAHLYVTGVFDEAKVERAVRAAFTGWAAGPSATVHPPVPVNHRQLELVDRPNAVQSSVRVGLPVADPTNADWIRLNVTDALLGGAFGSRITSNIREDKGYTYSPFSFVAAWPKVGVWTEVADVTTNVTGPSLKEIFYEVNRLRDEAPPEKELTGIKNNMVGLFTIQNSSRNGLINQLQFVDQYGLGDAYLSGYVKNVMQVTPAEVQGMAQKYLDPNRMTITVVGDKKVVEPQLEPYRAGVP